MSWTSRARTRADQMLPRRADALGPAAASRGLRPVTNRRERGEDLEAPNCGGYRAGRQRRSRLPGEAGTGPRRGVVRSRRPYRVRPRANPCRPSQRKSLSRRHFRGFHRHANPGEHRFEPGLVPRLLEAPSVTRVRGAFAWRRRRGCRGGICP